MSSQFITGNALNHALEQLFENASNDLILISPYIKLHERYASVLKSKLENDKLRIRLVFGKNEEDPSRSMGRTDLEFFMQFPNIEILYEPRLHAKYYANEIAGIVTSMNLYSYSQDHNIEAGVMMDVTSTRGELANRVLGRTDMEDTAFRYFERVIEQAELIYLKEPQYESALLGLSKKYTGSEVTVDRIAELFSAKKGYTTSAKPTSPRAPVNTRTTPRGTSSDRVSNTSAQGYCIRTGKPIPFNVKRPLSDEAFKSWSRYKDASYAEKYCHFSGEASNGDTSVAKPILKKNWSKAKAAHVL